MSKLFEATDDDEDDQLEFDEEGEIDFEND